MTASHIDSPVDGVEDARAVLRRHGRTFFFASHLLGQTHAARAATLYAFCRHVDDLADEAADVETAAAELSTVSHALKTGHSNDPRVAAMLALQQETRMAALPALALVEGVASDLHTVRVADEDELIRYAWRVAGTVGLMMCNVLDVHDPRAAPFAVDLGIAMQLTNIARDVGEDARMGRRYLPTSWIGAVEPVAIAAPDLALQRSLEGATKRLLALADRYYASGEAGLGFLPLRARFGIFSAARMYRAIGGRIAADGHRSWAQRAVIGSAGKVGHASLAAALMAIQPRLHRRDAAHDPSLQDALVRIDGAHE